MKKTLLFAAAILALAACSKENAVKEEGPIDASKIVFDIKVENADATKAVKTAWESGDVVYAFFEDNTTQYVKMTYDGTYWVYKDKDNGTSFTGLNLTASGKKVSAVYMPAFVCSAAPTYSTDKWTFGSVNGYFQTTTAAGVAYTVTSTSDVTTLSATLSLAAPSGISQIFIPSSEYSAPASGNEHVLTATHIIPFVFSGIAPGGAASYGTTTNGFPLTAYSGTIGGETGYYFWGILEGAGTYGFTFQLVERNAAKGYAISSKSKTVTGKTVGSNVAVKLTGLTDNGKFVSLGYAGGPLWATGNLIEDSPYIAAPDLEGTLYQWGYTTPYSGSPEAPKADGDFADAATAKNASWHVPSKTEFDGLTNDSNTTAVWKAGWTDIGNEPNKGGLLVTSKVNGISLLIAPSTGTYGDGRGWYWTSTPAESTRAYYLFLDKSNNFYTAQDGSNLRTAGYALRPIK